MGVGSGGIVYEKNIFEHCIALYNAFSSHTAQIFLPKIVGSAYPLYPESQLLERNRVMISADAIGLIV